MKNDTRMNMVKCVVWIVFAVFSIALCGCAKEGMPSATLTVFAGAGTAPVMNVLAEKFTAQSGIHIIYNYANSAQLARQLEAGTPGDVYLSANRKWMNYAIEKGCINTNACWDLLTTDLVVVVPKGHPVDVDFCVPRGDQTFDAPFAIGDPGFNPAGIYAEQSFRKLGWWDTLKPHFITADIINKVLQYVELNEASAGVVFRSLAALSDKVDVAGVLPKDTHKPIRFPVAECKNAKPEAGAFVAFLRSRDAAKIFIAYGWETVERKE